MSAKYTLTKDGMQTVRTDREDVRIQHEAAGYSVRQNPDEQVAKGNPQVVPPADKK